VRTLRSLVAVTALILSFCAFAQDQAFTNRSTELREKPDANAATLATLPENAGVKVLARAGAWTRVEAAGRTGFVRVFHLRFPATVEAGASSGGNPLSAIGGFFSGQKSDDRARVATTGVRGLSKEDVKNASPDEAALKSLKSYRADRPAAERFAKEGRLAAVKVPDPAGDAKGGRQ
jgi:SH3 domain-containing protein